MTRTPVYRHRLEWGEDAAWTAPAGAAKWLAWRKTALQAAFGTSAAELAGPSLYGGAPPTWKEIGGFDIAGGAR